VCVCERACVQVESELQSVPTNCGQAELRLIKEELATTRLEHQTQLQVCVAANSQSDNIPRWWLVGGKLHKHVCTETEILLT
jgi:hypothetical protein